jgi:hypothetical protein
MATLTYYPYASVRSMAWLSMLVLALKLLMSWAKSCCDQWSKITVQACLLLQQHHDCTNHAPLAFSAMTHRRGGFPPLHSSSKVCAP